MSFLGESKHFTIFIRKIKALSIREYACGDLRLNLSGTQQYTSTRMLRHGAADASTQHHAMQAAGEAKARSVPGQS